MQLSLANDWANMVIRHWQTQVTGNPLGGCRDFVLEKWTKPTNTPTPTVCMQTVWIRGSGGTSEEAKLSGHVRRLTEVAAKSTRSKAYLKGCALHVQEIQGDLGGAKCTGSVPWEAGGEAQYKRIEE